MSYEERKKYLIVILISAGICMVGLTNKELVAEYQKQEQVAISICFGLFGGIVVHILWLMKTFFDKRTKREKIVFLFFLPVIFQISCLIGTFSFLPYQIYNVIKILKLRKDCTRRNNRGKNVDL